MRFGLFFAVAILRIFGSFQLKTEYWPCHFVGCILPKSLRLFPWLQVSQYSPAIDINQSIRKPKA